MTTQFIFKEALSAMIDNCLNKLIVCNTKQGKEKRAVLTQSF